MRLFFTITLLFTSAAVAQESATLTIDLAQAKAKVSPVAAKFSYTVPGLAIQVPELKAQ